MPVRYLSSLFRWKIAGTFYNNSNLTFVENAFGADKDNTGVTGRICGTWFTRNRTAQYKSIEFIGSNDLDSPALTLNTMPRFLGKDLYFDGNFLRLPSPILFRSYGFTGKENWTLFTNSNFSGASECLDAAVDPSGTYAVTFNVNKTFTVGSIWRGGCGPTSAPIGGPDPATKRPNKWKWKKESESQGHPAPHSGGPLIVILIALLSHLVAGRA